MSTVGKFEFMMIQCKLSLRLATACDVQHLQVEKLTPLSQFSDPKSSLVESELMTWAPTYSNFVLFFLVFLGG